MANMSYCRFRNTLAALEDCATELQETECPTLDISTEEIAAMKELRQMCEDFMDLYDGHFGE